MVNNNPLLSLAQMCQLLNVDQEWLKKNLRLHLLNPDVIPLVERGVIRLGHAMEMTRIPNPEQVDWVERAKTYPFKDFSALVREYARSRRSKGIRVDDGSKEYTPYPIYRTMSVLKNEIKNPKKLVDLAETLSGLSPLEILKEGLRFALQIDQLSMNERIGAYNKKMEEAKKAEARKVREDAEKKIQNLQAEILEFRKKLERQETTGENLDD
jgi:hypothetical protein